MKTRRASPQQKRERQEELAAKHPIAAHVETGSLAMRFMLDELSEEQFAAAMKTIEAGGALHLSTAFVGRACIPVVALAAIAPDGTCTPIAHIEWTRNLQ